MVKLSVEIVYTVLTISFEDHKLFLMLMHECADYN